jgi:hypothetical protein
MHNDNPEVERHKFDGIAWSIDHEEDEWKSHVRNRRNGSRMDYLNDWVGWDRANGSDHQSCEIMLRRSALDSIFIGVKRDPFAWANSHDYEYFRPVYRKLRDNGSPVYATGKRCSEIGI